jgi:hypothetical protein
MIIKFHHFEHLCSAYVAHKSADTGSTIVAHILDFNAQLGHEIIFIHSDGEKWRTISDIKTKFPFTYFNLCKKLNEAFPGNTFIS